MRLLGGRSSPVYSYSTKFGMQESIWTWAVVLIGVSGRDATSRPARDDTR
jgi:hypothetical protein